MHAEIENSITTLLDLIEKIGLQRLATQVVFEQITSFVDALVPLNERSNIKENAKKVGLKFISEHYPTLGGLAKIIDKKELVTEILKTTRKIAEEIIEEHKKPVLSPNKPASPEKRTSNAIRKSGLMEHIQTTMTPRAKALLGSDDEDDEWQEPVKVTEAFVKPRKSISLAQVQTQPSPTPAPTLLHSTSAPEVVKQTRPRTYYGTGTIITNPTLISDRALSSKLQARFVPAPTTPPKQPVAVVLPTAAQISEQNHTKKSAPEKKPVQKQKKSTQNNAKPARSVAGARYEKVDFFALRNSLKPTAAEQLIEAVQKHQSPVSKRMVELRPVVSLTDTSTLAASYSSSPAFVPSPRETSPVPEPSEFLTPKSKSSIHSERSPVPTFTPGFSEQARRNLEASSADTPTLRSPHTPTKAYPLNQSPKTPNPRLSTATPKKTRESLASSIVDLNATGSSISSEPRKPNSTPSPTFSTNSQSSKKRRTSNRSFLSSSGIVDDELRLEHLQTVTVEVEHMPVIESPSTPTLLSRTSNPMPTPTSRTPAPSPHAGSYTPATQTLKNTPSIIVTPALESSDSTNSVSPGPTPEATQSLEATFRRQVGTRLSFSSIPKTPNMPTQQRSSRPTSPAAQTPEPVQPAVATPSPPLRRSTRVKVHSPAAQAQVNSAPRSPQPSASKGVKRTATQMESESTLYTAPLFLYNVPQVEQALAANVPRAEVVAAIARARAKR